jgi:phage shock protein E
MFQGPCDPHPCIEFGLLPVWASWSYAVRAFCPYSPGAPAGAQPPGIDLLKEARTFLDMRGALLLDIRTVEEYEEFHFEGAILVPTPNPPLTGVAIEHLRQQLLAIVCQPNVRYYRPIVTYCRKGIRAGIAAELLREAGFLYSICAGGIETTPLRKLTECGVELCPC